MTRYFAFLFGLFILVSCTKNENNIPLTPVVKEPEVKKKNIIFLIGDGMGLAHITAARTVNGGQLSMLTCSYTGIQSTHAADKYVTDSGASSTAMACGKKVNYYSIGVDTEGNSITSILELAESNNLSTGLITTSHIAHATPAAFYAHQLSRFEYENIALELVDKDVEFFLGGGSKYFNQRTDGFDLMDTLVKNGYQVVEELSQINGDKKVAVFIAEGSPPAYDEGRGDVLPNAVEIALKRLSTNENGFFLMIEGAQIDWGADENDQNKLMNEMLDFDRAVGKALSFAKNDGNTLVVVTGDHETGGYALLDGNLENNTVEGEFLTIEHTGTMVPVFAYGPGSEMFTGVYENTEFYFKFLDFYSFNE